MPCVRCRSNNLQNIKIYKNQGLYCLTASVSKTLMMLSKKEYNLVETLFLYLLCVRFMGKFA